MLIDDEILPTVLSYKPITELDGICTGILKEQLSPPDKEPLVNMTTSVPDNTEPLPHTSFKGKPVATNPVNVASKSSLNVMLAALLLLSKLVKDTFKVAACPGVTVNGSKTILTNCFCTFKKVDALPIRLLELA